MWMTADVTHRSLELAVDTVVGHLYEPARESRGGVLVLGGLSLLLYFMEVWEYGGAWVAVMYFLGMASVFILCGLLGRFLRMLICG